MTNEQKLKHLLKVLKAHAGQKHCCDGKGCGHYYYPLYDGIGGGDYYYPPENSEDAFDDGFEYGEIDFARTLLKQIGENFEYPL